jgi:hypothetical protein
MPTRSRNRLVPFFGARFASGLVALAMTTSLAALFPAGSAHAADDRLNLAEDGITKAIAQLQAAVVPNQKGQRCQKSVDAAVAALEKAMAAIEKAKTCADR